MKAVIDHCAPKFVHIHFDRYKMMQSPPIEIVETVSSSANFSDKNLFEIILPDDRGISLSYVYFPTYTDEVPFNVSSRYFDNCQEEFFKEVTKLFKLSESDEIYLREMWRQKAMPNISMGPLRIIKDRDNPGENNFILGCMLSASEREKLLGTIEYSELLKDPLNAAAAKSVTVTLNSMDGGIGESVDRKKFKAIHGLGDVLGAKGTDLGFSLDLDNRQIFVSIAEAKILQIIMIANRGDFGGVEFQPLINHQSINSYKELINAVYLYDKIDSSITVKRTYRQVLEGAGIKLLEMLNQADLPAIEEATGQITLNQDAPKQPGGHGQWGVQFLYDAYKNLPSSITNSHVRVFYNGDNVNSRVDASIAGYMVRNNLPIIKLTTVATPIDRKGGKDGVRVVFSDNSVIYVPMQMEVADAKSVGQEQLFYEAGQVGGIGEVGKQPFNTNIIYFNLNLLHGMLKELAEVVGEEKLKEVIAPSLIAKPAKKGNDGLNYIPIDGAIGSSIHNLNAFFQMSPDPAVKAILKRRGLDRLLFFVNVPRTEFFTPVKSAFDMWLQAYSDYYRFNVDTMALEESCEGLTPPEVELESVGLDGKDDKHWKEVQNLVDAFGNASTVGLKSLKIKGKFLMKDAVLRGDVEIINESLSTIDLNEGRFLDVFSRTSEGRLLIENVSMTISR